ncbi:circumsporozoite protein-like [Vespula squamosa]|uniref:Circumsporozoite protein-like n=1 Tax=Vespula squamosa TaxID=30214 RepID=A0ABD2BE52_VESSQ
MDEPQKDATDAEIPTISQSKDQVESEMPINPESKNDSEIEIIETNKESTAADIIDVDDTKETKENVDTKSELEESFTIFDFEPILYFFKISPMVSDDRHYQDHVFGVVWLLFSKQQQKFPSIPQLHCCLKFLQELKNRDGTYTNDVSLCIQTVQDNLIKQYAKLGILLKYTNEDVQKDEELVLNEQELTNKEENNILPQKSVHSDETKDELIIISENLTSVDDKKNISEDNVINNLSKPTIQSNPYANYIGLCGVKCQKEILLNRDVSKIISLTYTEMLSRGPLPCIEQMNNKYNISLGTPISFESLKKFMEEFNLPKEYVTSMNKKQLIEFFTNVRKKYVETIKEQVDKIYNLENFMKDIDRQSFKAYVTNDLIKRLNKLGDSDKGNNM